MNRIPIVTSAVALLLSTGQPVESPTISTPSAVDDYSMLADPDIPNPESVRHKSELAWHAWRASIQDPEDCVVMCWEQHVDQTHVAPLAPFRPINERGAGSHAHPWAGSCDDKHPPCGQDGGGPSELMTLIEDAIRIGDTVRLRSILDEDNGKYAYIAWERSSIQVLDCTESGELLAHIPVPRDLLAVVTD